ncbi:MAG TPA: hypothetical protein DCP71_10410 [Verrucomicrobiales bacterium]|nr:hypothetical protein [Verrucomicrobiales bacterium]
MGQALERFEAQFQYPLGDNSHFSISHGQAYLPFFSAMGPATLLVAEREGEVIGTLARVQRWLHWQGECPMKQLAHYLCDLKISPQARGSRVLALLMNEARRQIERSKSLSCYGIVMNGTGRLPMSYTGRVGIPLFEKVAEIVVLRLSSLQNTEAKAGHTVKQTCPGPPACIVTGGRTGLRSQMPPVPILDERGIMRGLLEDTRLAKRLWTDGGAEMVSAHLSGLHFDTPSKGAETIRRAVQEASQQQIPAVFTAVPKSRVEGLLPYFEDLNVEEAPATIYGYQLKAGYDWWVDTAEI